LLRCAAEAVESIQILTPNDGARIRLGETQVVVQYTVEGSNRAVVVYLTHPSLGDIAKLAEHASLSQGTFTETFVVNTGTVPVGLYVVHADLVERLNGFCIVRATDSKAVNLWTPYAFDVLQRSGAKNGDKPSSLGTLALRRRKADGSWVTVAEYPCVTTGDPEQIHTPNTYCTNGDTPPSPLGSGNTNPDSWLDVETHVHYDPYHQVEDSILGAEIFKLPSPLQAPCGCQRTNIEIHGGGPLPNIKRDLRLATLDDAIPYAMQDQQVLYITHGCIRVHNAAAAELANKWAEFRIGKGCEFKFHVP